MCETALGNHDCLNLYMKRFRAATIFLQQDALTVFQNACGITFNVCAASLSQALREYSFMRMYTNLAFIAIIMIW